jgi:hypothetical protein
MSIESTSVAFDNIGLLTVYCKMADLIALKAYLLSAGK